MHHRLTPTDPQKRGDSLEDQKAAFTRRVHEVRVALYGESGAERLAELVGVPRQTWINYESGVSMPAIVALRFLEVARLSPSWLLSGDGPRYVVRHPIFRCDSVN
jgi:DNA-binding XRE family transcriptional regulator